MRNRSRAFLAATAASAVALVASLLTGVIPAAHAAPILLSQGKPTTASSAENAVFPASSATDGNTGTRWSSAFSDPQWLQVDLQATSNVTQFVLNWEPAYATAFQLQVSDNATTWTTIYSTTTGTGGTQTINAAGTGRYVRMYGTARATQYGYSLWEFQVFGVVGGSSPSPGTSSPAASPGTCSTANSALGHTATASSEENAGSAAAAAVDGNLQSRWSSAFSDPQWLQVDLGGSQSVCKVVLSWEAAYATAYQIQVSANGTSWTNIYSTTTSTGGTQTLDISGSGRYVRMNGTARATAYGYSLWEFAVYSTGGPTSPSPSPQPTLSPGQCPWVGSAAPISQRVAQLLAAMSTDQKISILHGNGNASPYIGDLTGIPSLCIPNLGLQDGPVGVGDGMGGVTQLPDATATAAMFDPALAEQLGAVAGAEFAAKGANVALGPTLNIVRDPRWGRAFETYSEDPHLTAQTAAAYIRGIQGQGVMAQAKHLAVYNQETNRNTPQDNAIVDTRVLQEIYLPGFQASAVQGATASYMCAYSTVNGTYACQNPYLMNTAMYQQAQFGGFITCDWGAAHSTVESANAGMTMEMPGGYFYADFLKQAVTAGTVSMATLNTMVSRILTQMFAFGLFDRAPTGSPTAYVTTPAHVQIARQGADEGTVLLKNNGVLPLSTSTTHSIAVIGVDGGAGVQSIGGGSATVTSSGTSWPITGLQNRVAGTGTTVTYNDGTNVTNAVNLARTSDVAIVFASNNYGNEGSDQASIDLPNNQNSLISQVAAANAKTIVVLHTNSATTMPWLGSVAGVFEGFYSGQEVGNSIAALLFGDVNPSGKLPVTFPQSLADVPASTAAQWPGANNQVQYSEGLGVGYRWYDGQNKTPLFPFGFGLSYTTFGFSNLQVGAFSGGKATVTATVTNTGTRAGTEVAQLYVGAPAANGEPVRQLRGYQRVTLNAGASQTVTFTVTAKDLAYYNTNATSWTTPAGAYTISVGNSSRSLPVTGTLTVGAAVTSSVLNPTGGTISVPNPYGMSSRVGQAVNWNVAGTGTGLTYSATGLPSGLSISAAGVVTGSATGQGTKTVTVTARDASGQTGSATFVWTTV
ncbi:glycoside hydrolase family 3 C-terminal domain-containing protein [Hamadaea tsunoensis]|uniref:glycoside hydrolase family 3 C-terminal domain-containing protein n=1 Tax=Hamadaea tsunoensis TaxID=53368 RepID=UPI001FDEE0CF|nr:glycoside hydrolase family 3 C-terminal domain-containing protein [Hamadaea tsunoensis]